MDLTFAHYRNRFCMFRTYYALAKGLVRLDGLDISVVEVPDPPSHAQEEALIRGEVHVANLYLLNFLRRRAQGAPIVGICTEWKTTSKGNGVFVLADGPVKEPRDLAGSAIASQHDGPHMLHTFLLKRQYGVDVTTLRWQPLPQEELIAALKSGQVDAVVLLDQFFFHGESDPSLRCLYTDGDAWRDLYGFPELIKHIVAVRESLVREDPALPNRLAEVFRASLAYGEEHLDRIATEFMDKYGGDRGALLASARYPKLEFTFTEAERRLAEAEMDQALEMGQLPRRVDIASAFGA